MATFTDATGKAWDVALSIGSAMAVKSRLGVCLVDLTEEDRAAKRSEADIQRLLADPVLFINVMYVLCEQQAQACDISDEGFGRSLDLDSLTSALEALVEALTVFTLPRTMKVRGADKMRERAAKLRAKMLKDVDAALGKVETEIDMIVSEYTK